MLQDFKFQTPRPPPVTAPGTPVAPHPLDKLGGLSSLRQLVRARMCAAFRVEGLVALSLPSNLPRLSSTGVGASAWSTTTWRRGSTQCHWHAAG